MKRLSTLLMATAMAFPGIGALAQDATEHVVSIERYGYYPAKIYVAEGDTIRFVNNSPNWVTIYSSDYSDNNSEYDYANPCDEGDPNGNGLPEFSGSKDGFSSGWIGTGNDYTMTVTACTETTFYEPYIYQYSFDGNNMSTVIVFGSAPNG